MREKSWEQVFWDALDDHVPEAPRHVQLAKVVSVQPVVVSLGGLRYEQAKGQVVINAQLLKHEEKNVVISAPSPHGTITATVTHPTAIKEGDSVAVVQLEGKQQVIVLCKVVK